MPCKTNFAIAKKVYVVPRIRKISQSATEKEWSLPIPEPSFSISWEYWWAGLPASEHSKKISAITDPSVRLTFVGRKKTSYCTVKPDCKYLTTVSLVNTKIGFICLPKSQNKGKSCAWYVGVPWWYVHPRNDHVTLQPKCGSRMDRHLAPPISGSWSPWPFCSYPLEFPWASFVGWSLFILCCTLFTFCSFNDCIFCDIVFINSFIVHYCISDLGNVF
jgi:hypothetical protein